MKHLFQPGAVNEPTFILLHGTGGNETDLLQIGQAINPQAALLGIKGNILEQGMPRFFKRLAEGLFDEEDLRFRTTELFDFINEAAATYHFDVANSFIIGYSNGANIGGSLLLTYGDVFAGAMLLHPMVPMRKSNYPALTNTPIFISAGRNDNMCAPAETDELIAIFEASDSDVTGFWHDFGHRLIADEINEAKKWYHSL